MKRALRAAATLAVLLPAPSLLALHFRDGPPARVTGGFGEDSCLACHSGKALNEAGGRLTLSGFPEMYVPGATYELELEMSRPPSWRQPGSSSPFASPKTGAGRNDPLSAEMSHASACSTNAAFSLRTTGSPRWRRQAQTACAGNSPGMPPSAPGKSPSTPRPSRATATTHSSATPCTRSKQLPQLQKCPSNNELDHCKANGAAAVTSAR